MEGRSAARIAWPARTVLQRGGAGEDPSGGAIEKNCRSNRVPTHGILSPCRIRDGHEKPLPVPTPPPESLALAGPADPLTPPPSQAPRALQHGMRGRETE